MPENRPEKIDSKQKLSEEETEPRKSDWGEDQKSRRYYYDDAHGYEVYSADDDEDGEPSAI